MSPHTCRRSDLWAPAAATPETPYYGQDSCSRSPDLASPAPKSGSSISVDADADVVDPGRDSLPHDAAATHDALLAPPHRVDDTIHCNTWKLSRSPHRRPNLLGFQSVNSLMNVPD